MGGDPDVEAHPSRPRSETETVVIWILSVIVFSGLFTAVVRGSTGLLKVVKFFSDTETNASEELKVVVQHRMQEIKVSRMHLYLALICCAYIPWYCSSVIQFAQGSFPKISTPASEITWLVFQAACASVLVRPAVLTPKSLDLVTAVVVAHAVIQETPFLCCTEEGFNINRSGVHIVLIMGVNLARGLGSWRETIILALGNIVFIGCMGYTRWSAFRNKESWGRSAERAGVWGLLALCTMVLGAVIEAGFRQLVTQGLQLAEAREMHKAATALLRRCYDVVVELDSSGSLDGDSLDLGSLLLRADHQRSMRGIQLADLIVDEEDRGKFQRRLAATRTKTVGLAENMYVTMKDALGNTLHMELMWFACRRAEGDVHFIVGIREFWDQTQEACSGPSPGHGASDFFPAVPSSASEASSSSEGTASWSQSEPQDVDVDQAMIVVDMTNPFYPIRSMTTGFRTRVGYVPRNAPLSRLVKKPELMVRWLKDGVNSVMRGMQPPGDCSIWLRMPQGNLRACCRLVVTEEDLRMPDVYAESVVVLFYNISHYRSRHAGGSGGRSGTPARPSPGSAESPGSSASPGSPASPGAPGAAGSPGPAETTSL